MRALGRPTQLLQLLFGLTLSSRLLDPQPPPNKVTDADVANFRKKYEEMRKTFEDLSKRFADFKKKRATARGGRLSIVHRGGLPKSIRAHEDEKEAHVESGEGSMQAHFGPTSSTTPEPNHEGGWPERSSSQSQASSSTSFAPDDRGYALWRVDACLGTEEKNETRTKRSDLPTNGFRERLSTILSDVSASGVNPKTRAFAWYNMPHDCSKPFVIKFTMDPTVYNYVYMQHYRNVIPPEEYQMAVQQNFEAAQMIFDENYYGDGLLTVYDASEHRHAIPAGHKNARMLRASDDLVLKTGPILLFTTPEPLLLEELTDEVMESVEAAVFDAFKGYSDKPEPFWHSVGLLPLPAEGPTIYVNETRFLIGSKIDVVTFARTLPPKVQKTFLAKYMGKKHMHRNGATADYSPDHFQRHVVTEDSSREGHRGMIHRPQPPRQRPETPTQYYRDEGVDVTGSPAELAFASFLYRLDAFARVHGSYACGLADDSSDVDLLTNEPLAAILSLVQQGNTGFALIEHVTAARVPRLVLSHQKTGVIVDVIESVMDPWAAAKDNFIRTWLACGRPVRYFALRVRNWGRKHRNQLPRDEGYPNNFMLLLSALWYLRAYEGFPRYCGAGPLAHLLPIGQVAKSEADLADRFYWGWLRWMAGGVSAQRVLDVRDLQRPPFEGSPWSWTLVEPVEGRVVCKLPPVQANYLASLAAESCKGFRCVEANYTPQANTQPCG